VSIDCPSLLITVLVLRLTASSTEGCRTTTYLKHILREKVVGKERGEKEKEGGAVEEKGREGKGLNRLGFLGPCTESFQ
jgi:hypothetical protein